MSLKEQLFADLKEAMKQKDNILKDTIQMVRAGILQIEKDQKIELEDDGIIEVIIKEIKKCNDVLPDFQKSGRQDLIDELNQKLTILKSYLPEQLSVEEINEIVLYAIKEIGASSMKDMGKVMALVSDRTKGRAENKTISEIVKKCLQS
ncbi:GatB/YqeY domain-containing protein [uncultured Tyzzerella sp.]|uniref:GatB/YqeY domain-containing protein n=1 Tax=uncultured Tyzzerella sp. TaxID=2321398 RepID=UPI00294241FE|nr:GatB/YqeY domain-containing protein [uncultured Tyzzerella sp.]